MPSQAPARAAVLRTKADIAPVLQELLEAREKVVSFLEGGALLFDSRIAQIDVDGNTVALEASSTDAANAALLAQPRCIFSCSIEGARIEFVAAAPRRSGAHIVLDFPEVLTRWRRAHQRTTVGGVPLQVTADSEGIMPFEGLVVDIAPGGLGFLIHEESIALEPGTLLKKCVIDIPGKPGGVVVDLEVCYSQPIVLGDGTQSVRSGCRFVDTSGAARELVRFYVTEEPPADEDKQDLLP